MSDIENFVISLSGERPPSEVARELGAQGLRSVRVLSEISCILGAADASALARLRKVRGVSSVERDVSIQIPETGTGETW